MLVCLRQPSYQSVSNVSMEVQSAVRCDLHVRGRDYEFVRFHMLDMLTSFKNFII